MKKEKLLKKVIVTAVCVCFIGLILALTPSKEVKQQQVSDTTRIVLTQADLNKLVSHINYVKEVMSNSDMKAREAKACSTELDNAMNLLGKNIEQPVVKPKRSKDN